MSAFFQLVFMFSALEGDDSSTTRLSKQPMIPFTHSPSHLVTVLSVTLIRLYFMRDSSATSAPEKPVSDL